MRMDSLPPMLALAGLALLVGVVEGRAQSSSYPYCAVQGGYGAYENCGYPSIAACQAAVSGVGGHCQVNPRFVDRGYREEEREPPPRYRARR